MKLYDEIKAEMEAVPQQTTKAKKSKLTDVLKQVKCLYKEFGFIAGKPRGVLTKGRGKNVSGN